MISYVQLGRMDEAKAALELLLKVQPYYNGNLVSAWTQHWQKNVQRHYLASLQKAGLPAWPYGFDGSKFERLGGDEIKALFTSSRHAGRTQRFGKFELDNAANGDWKLRLIETNYPATGGNGFVENGMRCLILDDMLFGRKICSPVYRNPAGTAAGRNEYVAPYITDIQWFSVVD